MTSHHRALQLSASCLPAQAATLGDRPAAGTAPACVTNRGEPNQGAFSAQPSPATRCTSLLRPPRSWCGMYPGPHATFSPARADQAGKSHNTLCVHPRATAGAEKALYGHREKQTAFCTAAFQFTNIHQLSLQRKASNFFSPLGMKVLGLRRPKYDPGSYCLETGSSNQLFIQELQLMVTVSSSTGNTKFKCRGLTCCFFPTKELPFASLRRWLPCSSLGTCCHRGQLFFPQLGETKGSNKKYPF